MKNSIEKNEHLEELKPTLLEQKESFPNEIEVGEMGNIDDFVHTHKNFGNDIAPSYEDIDTQALGSLTHQKITAGKKLSRKEKKLAKKELKQQKKESRKKYSSVKSQLKDRDKELSDKTADYRRKRENAKNVLNYIGYNSMYQDGICEVEEGLFSSSIAFDDTSYHSVRDAQQKAMFSGLTRLYDQFSANTILQMSVINTPILKEEIGNRSFFKPDAQDNEFAKNDAIIFNEILNDKIKEGVSNIRRHRYLTYSINAENADSAAHQLSRIETETSRILSTIGSKAHLMNGTERLSVIHSLLNPYKPFYFDYQKDISARSVQTTKDCIAPTQIDFKPDGLFTDCFKLDNGVYGQVLVMKKFGSELSDRALADIVDLPIPMAVTWFVQPMEKSKAINFVRTRSAWIDKEIIEEQRSAVNKGYDFSILPQELKYSKDETEDVLDHLQNKNQRLYVFTGLIYTYAESKEALDNQVMRIISTARQNSIEVDTYDYRQRRGLNSILPLGHNHVEISRMFTTAQVAILVPFATQELDDFGGNYYGQNKHSKNLVICDRKKLTSPMGFVCGKTGSGKGMFIKTEMTGTIFSNPGDEIFIIDRAGEYTEITERYGGNTYHFGVGTNTYLNPFDTVSVEHLGRSEQIAFKIDAMLAQAGASAAEAGQNLSETDQSIIQRCVEFAFERAIEREDNLPPTLQDFYDIARQQPEHQAANIALRYERFVKGSMDFFNHQSNMDFNNRIIDFNLKDLPDSMLVFALINVCEAVRNRMYYNAKRGIRTWLYVEEMQSLFAYPTVLNYFSRFSNEGRKFGLLLTGITQNAVAMLNNKAAQNIVLNADFLMLLKQSPLDRMKWVELLNLSEQEEECIDESAEAGDGLLIAGNARVPIRGKFPSGNVLYDLFSTNPNEKQRSFTSQRSGKHK
ncbi:VirB4-like conjugal transfer ATPase, CD1110 family [Enterococcus sp. AN402]|uniref:VirB4-like conjugal transfer ATPase, CD1110 family n=1 Tax=Enterococcus sp. AN402 TaxID=3151386 RepID=UPI00345B077B